MNLRQLNNFVCIVDTGSLTRTAAKIGIAQPALTFQIARMEEELGTQLLIRSARGVLPTGAGLVLYRHARTVLRQMAQIPQMVRATGAEMVGEVSIGFATSLVSLFSSVLAEQVLERYPLVKLRLIEGESSMQHELVTNSRVDLALLMHYGPCTELYDQPLFTQRLAMLCDGSNPHDRDGEPITLGEAARRAIGMPGVGNPIRAAVDEALRKAGAPAADVRIEINSMVSLVGAVARGLGPMITAWMPKDSYTAPGVVFRPIVEPELALHVSLCTSKLVPVSLAAHAVQNILAKLVSNRLEAGDWPGARPVGA